MNETIHFRVLQHQGTGLYMAMSHEYPGFVVHGNTEEELEGKIATAFESFIRQTTGDEVKLVLKREPTPPGFGPPSFTGITAEAA